jgi:hypothetical protein
VGALFWTGRYLSTPRICLFGRRSSSGIRWRLPGERDVAAHLTSFIHALRHLAVHTVEAFPRRRGTIDGVIYQRARHQTQQRREELNE